MNRESTKQEGLRESRSLFRVFVVEEFGLLLIRMAGTIRYHESTKEEGSVFLVKEIFLNVH